MAVIKLSDWNNIIGQVNAIRSAPPAGCDALPPIEEIPPNSLWRKSFVRRIQEALQETCPSITFEPIPDIVKRSTLDEIEAAMSQAWCNCEDDGCTPEKVAEEDGTEFIVFSPSGPEIVSNCFGNNTTIPLTSVIDGMQFGQHNVFGRIWRVFRRVTRYNETVLQTQLAAGIMPCNGIVSYAGSVQIETAFGPVAVLCSTCIDSACQEQLDEAQERLESPEPTDPESVVFILVLDNSSADCGLPGDCP